MRYFYYYLTGIVLILIFLTLNYIHIPFPQVPTYLTYTMDKPFEVLDLRRHLQAYEDVKASIQTQKKILATQFQKLPAKNKKEGIEAAKNYLFQSITQDLIPYWFQTEWDFNGTTETPRKGQIACGYFVTTVLKHAGIELDKYYLSRASSATLIRHLCDPQNTITIRKNNFPKLLQHLENQPDGLYIVGLDTHVGFIEKKGDDLYFIHSRKPRSAGVTREKVKESKTLQKSKIHVVGNLLANQNLIINWLNVKSVKS
jgi:hypothetical protein